MPQDLTKRVPTKMKTPWCERCQKPVTRWMYHQTGHTDYTPILTLTCHFETYTFGSSQRYASDFREEMRDRFLSGNEHMRLHSNGTYNGPTEPANSQPNPDSSGGTVSPSDTSRVGDQKSGSDTDVSNFDYRQFGKADG